MYVLDSGSGGELNKTAWARAREERERKEEEEEEEKKRAAENMRAGVGDSYSSNITPSTAFHIRNRFLSRVGTKVCIYIESCAWCVSSVCTSSHRSQTMCTHL